MISNLESQGADVTASRELWTETSLPSEDFSALRRQMLLEGCKWDAQVGDECTLAPFPLVMKRSVWNRLTVQAEQLTTEAFAAEQEIAQRPDLLRQLGLPQALQAVLADGAPLTCAAGRVIRFDFHFTTGGWRISEANSDVPGGFTEASLFTKLMARHHTQLQPAGDPLAVWCDALAVAAGTGGIIALLSAPGYMEDHQVTSCLAMHLQRRGCRPHLAKPEQIQWHEGIATLKTSWHSGPLDLVVRFYQAEWLTRLPAESGWRYFFRGGKTPVANPALALISESKRFPLVWNQLSTRLPAWRHLLPETRDLRDAAEFNEENWLLKTALCNTGDTVSIPRLMPAHLWRQTKWRARLAPGNWIAQRRFESVPVPTPIGPRHVCVGIYTVNGKVAGAYTRLSAKPVINFAAVDAALLIDPNE
ncbi:MAG: glutathionylspermidine synthase family protein [Verrucomicrobiae bacterium]|nr:glutathionylspermidine synthase family protein [Verrucomicrobiae bacterium]